MHILDFTKKELKDLIVTKYKEKNLELNRSVTGCIKRKQTILTSLKIYQKSL
jgi:hypothetical protein